MAYKSRSVFKKRWVKNLAQNVIMLVFTFLMGHNIYLYLMWTPPKMIAQPVADKQEGKDLPMNWNLGREVRDEKEPQREQIHKESHKEKVEQKEPPKEEEHRISNNDNRLKIVILGQDSVATTLVGELFKNNPDALVYREPFQRIIDEYKNKQNILYDEDFYIKPNGKFRPIPLSVEKVISTVAVELLNCRFENVPKTLLYHEFMIKGQGFGSSSYQKCMKFKANDEEKPSLRELIDHYKVKLEECIPIMKKQCLSSEMAVLTTVHMTSEQLYRALRNDEKLKIVRVVRDPRNVVTDRVLEMSRDKQRDVTSNELQSLTLEFCTRKRYERKHYFDVMEEYWRNIITVEFEDFIDNPLHAARQVYRFIDRFIPIEVHTAIETTFDETNESYRKQYGKEKWKDHIKGTDLRKLTDECQI